MKFQFPQGFLWGAATSAHQVEGSNHNDWSEWELENAERLAREAEKRFGRLPVWNQIKSEAGNPKNYISGIACDHYHRFREDFDIAKSLGHNAHRFSIEWSRIEPEEGKFDEKAIEHYREVIKALRERGMEPFVTLWHYTLPIWFADRGGWLRSDAPECFARYVQRVVSAYQGDVKFWITENEPETFARHGYLVGDRPPEKKNIISAYRVIKNLLQAHKAAYRTIKSISPESQVGFAETVVYFEPYKGSLINKLVMWPIKWWRNNPLLGDFIRNSDFIGLEYYFHSRIRFNPFISRWGIQYNENKAVSDLDWEIYPDGLYSVLRDLNSYHKPIYVVENGLANANDARRARFIADHLNSVARAINLGVDVRGYFHWSLIDNFEWNLGFWPRFGLIEVNYGTLERKIRLSALEYKKIIAMNSIEI